MIAITTIAIKMITITIMDRYYTRQSTTSTKITPLRKEMEREKEERSPEEIEWKIPVRMST